MLGAAALAEVIPPRQNKAASNRTILCFMGIILTPHERYQIGLWASMSKFQFCIILKSGLSLRVERAILLPSSHGVDGPVKTGAACRDVAFAGSLLVWAHPKGVESAVL